MNSTTIFEIISEKKTKQNNKALFKIQKTRIFQKSQYEIYFIELNEAKWIFSKP